MPLFILFALIIAFFAILFALQNTGAIAIQFLIWQFQGPLALFLLFTLAAGIIVGLFTLTPALLKKTLKLSSQRRKFRDLEWNSQKTAEEVTAQEESFTLLQKNHQDVLLACDLVEPHTNLLKWKTLTQLLTYLTHQARQDVDGSQYGAITLFLIEVSLPDDHSNLNSDSLPSSNGTNGPAEPSVPEEILRGIAYKLEGQTLPNSWLHSDGVNQFAHIVMALSPQAASDYGKFLRDLLTTAPIQPPGETAVTITASMGGANTQQSNSIDIQHLVQSAEDALDHAKRRGRNRMRINQVDA